MITCSRCGKENQDHYKFCLGCGGELARPAAAPAGGTPAPAATSSMAPASGSATSAGHSAASLETARTVLPPSPVMAAGELQGDPGRIARAWAELMPRLGYQRYAAQGGDWGSIVTTCIGIQDPGNCIGIHLNMPIALPDPATMSDLTDKEKSAIAGMQDYNDWDSGYSKQQSTRPQTVSYGLTDSPAGQLTWILEKFWSWTDCDGHPENVLTRDELLDNVMLYWLPANAASSARLYWESFRGALAISDPVTVPVGCSIFSKEIFRTSRRWAEKRFAKVVYFNELTKGGHFAAFEQPEIFIREVRNCFRLIR